MLYCLLVGCMSCAVALHPGLLSTGSHFTDVEETIGVLCNVCWHTDALICTYLLAAGTVPCPSGDATGAPAQARDQPGRPRCECCSWSGAAV